MRPHDATRNAEANDAAWEAARGAVLGAAKWGAGAAILGAAGYALSPVYRKTTIQFKVFLQMSGMVLGGMIEADWRLRQYEQHVRVQKRTLRARARWDQYEEEFAASEKRNR